MTTVHTFRDVCLVNILIPAVQVINQILFNFYDAKNVPPDERKIVTIRAQYNSPPQGMNEASTPDIEASTLRS